MAGRLGDILVKHGAITQAQLDSALRSQGSERGMLGAIRLRRGLISMRQLGDALAEQIGVPFHEAIPEAINRQLVRLVPETSARHRTAVPVSINSCQLTLAMAGT